MMKSSSEIGHAKNVANFETLIATCKGYNSHYQPPKENLKIPALETLHTKAKQTILDVQTRKTAYNKAVNERKTAYEDLKSITTKVFNAFSISGAEPLAVQNFKSIAQKVRGIRNNSKPKPKSTENTNANPTPEPRKISTSQQSYDNIANHFSDLVQTLQQYPVYNPNEIQLQVVNLQNRLSDIQSKNTTLLNAYTAYSNAIIERNNTLYHPQNGLVSTAKDIKTYIKSVFGTKDPHYKQINGLTFNNVKI